MKFRMAENSLFAILLRSSWWVSFLVAGGIVLLSGLLLPAQFIVYGAIVAAPFLVIGFIAAWRQLQALMPPGSSDAKIIEANIAEASRLAAG